MNSKLQDKNTDLLFQAILQLRTTEECYKFFEDLCTVPEIKAMSQRLVVARMLTSKNVYNTIVEETGASTATISRVNRSLSYGCGGYEMVFDRIDNKEEESNKDA
ncbi:MAG: YerC/YecD family TrpR-related protein [Acutalibacteraceae bacterium]|nr:YerC/YecD family TrpR-related protein [Acutalibacteraceae bacterium]